MQLEKLKTKTKVNCDCFLMPSMASDFKKLLIEATDRKLPLEIHLDEIDGIDTLNFQLLVSCQKYCEQQNLDFSIKNFSESFENQAKMLGLFDILIEGEAS